MHFSPRVDQLLGFITRSVVCVPLLNGNNRIVGAIELINKIAPSSMASGEGTIPTSTAFIEMDMAILSSIGVFTGIAAENVDNLITMADQELYQCKNLRKTSQAMVNFFRSLLIKPSFCNCIRLPLSISELI